jgi:hypothetical protein
MWDNYDAVCRTQIAVGINDITRDRVSPAGLSPVPFGPHGYRCVEFVHDRIILKLNWHGSGVRVLTTQAVKSIHIPCKRTIT